MLFYRKVAPHDTGQQHNDRFLIGDRIIEYFPTIESEGSVAHFFFGIPPFRKHCKAGHNFAVGALQCKQDGILCFVIQEIIEMTYVSSLIQEILHYAIRSSCPVIHRAGAYYKIIFIKIKQLCCYHCQRLPLQAQLCIACNNE